MSELSRRKFLKSAGGGIAVSSTLLILPGRTLSAPSERVRHAVIGLGGQGITHCKTFASLDKGCEVVAVCCVDPERRAKAASVLPNPDKVAQHEDYRRVLDDKNIDTISIATPDHWHAPISIAAILAGKHVYVEKPCCHNVHEGSLLVEAAAKYKKCVQHGTQSRSGQGIREAVQFMREGNLGKVRMAKAINHQFRGPIGRALESDPPPGVPDGSE